MSREKPKIFGVHCALRDVHLERFSTGVKSSYLARVPSFDPLFRNDFVIEHPALAQNILSSLIFRVFLSRFYKSTISLDFFSLYLSFSLAIVSF